MSSESGEIGSGLVVSCARCGNTLTEPGALFFGVPVNGMVTKSHICADCVSAIRACINSGPQRRGQTQRRGRHEQGA